MPTTQRIPTIVGLLLVLGLVGILVGVSERFHVFSLLASKGIAAQNIEITNVTDSSATISWTTQEPVIGDVTITGASDKNRSILDDRDTQTVKKPVTTHHVTIKNLNPETSYSISIRNNGRAVDGPAQSISTFGQLTSGQDSALGPAYGSVVKGDATPAIGALVYLTVEGGQKLSTIVSPSGSWLIALNRVRAVGGDALVVTAERITEEVLVRTSDPEEIHAITDSLNDSPIPAMTLGKTYDFQKQQAKSAAGLAVNAESNNALSNVLGSATSQTKSYTVSFENPKNGAAIPGTKPLVSGTGIPSAIVVLTLGITKPYSDTTTVGNDGTWRYTPIKPLGIGKQSITMTTKDASGKPVAVTHMFEILKSGTQVLGDATPSATLTSTPSATPTESTVSGQPMPVSGSILPTLILLILATGLIAGGSVFLFL